MKKALKLIAVYFVILFTSIFFGTFLYSFFQNALNYVAGSENQFFQKKNLLDSFIYVSYVVCFLVCPFVAIYRVRHIHGVLQTLAYVTICLITWCVVFPSVYLLEKQVSSKHIAFFEEDSNLSKEFFRETDDKVYYITKDFHDGKSSAVVIDKAENGKVVFETVENSKTSELVEKSEPYREIGIKKAMKSENMFHFLGIRILVEKAVESFHKGVFDYFVFLSIALLLCSLYAISYFFDWRLLNSYAIFITTVFVIYTNISYYLPFFADLREKINSWKFFAFLGNRIDEPLIFVMNIFFSVVLISVGCVRAIVHYVKKSKEV